MYGFYESYFTCVNRIQQVCLQNIDSMGCKTSYLKKKKKKKESRRK